MKLFFIPHFSRSFTATRLCALILVLEIFLVSGCARLPASGPHDAFREVNPPIMVDDLELSNLAEAIQAQSQTLLASPELMIEVGPERVSRRAYQAALDRLAKVLQAPGTYAEKLEFISSNFRFFELRGGATAGEVLLTGYFEPIIPGSFKATSRFSRPLYAKPRNLLTIPLDTFSEKFKGEKPLKARLLNNRVLPFFTREDIDGKGALAHKGLELVWVDPVDAFFLQIQGSGTVVLPDNSKIHLVYSDKNGHRYEAIGKFVREKIAPQAVTMQRIEDLLRALPAQERNRIMYMNPSYVFFARSQRRAVTSLGVPATPGRTIAADSRFAPKGALVFLEFDKPVFSPAKDFGEESLTSERSARFVLDQDSGGAITGTGRIDLFWGRGDEAKKYAGVLQNKARALYLVPK